MSRVAGLLVLLCCLLEVERALGACNASEVSWRLDALLAEYARDVAPAPSGPSAGAGAVRVELALDVRHAAVHEPSSSVRLLADLRMSWKDSRLSWPAEAWGCETALVAAERLWRPDVELANALPGAGGGADGAAPLRARLSSDGAVAWVARLDAAVPLALDLSEWPRDTQHALFKFVSRAHTTDEMDLTVRNLKYATVHEAGSWELMSVMGETSLWTRGDGERRVAAWSVAVRRRAPAHAAATGGVLAAAALLLLAAALLPPLARPPLAAAASLTAALWLIAALARLPGASSCPRALGVMCALCACGAAMCACAALAVRVARCSKPPPPALRLLVAAASPLCSLLPVAVPDEGSGGAGEEGRGVQGAWAGAARLLDRALSALLAVAVLVALCVYL